MLMATQLVCSKSNAHLRRVGALAMLPALAAVSFVDALQRLVDVLASPGPRELTAPLAVHLAALHGEHRLRTHRHVRYYL